MGKSSVIFIIALSHSLSFAAFSNYNSILIGEQASGMGGAYTALFGDPSAVSFYNPSVLARMSGRSLNATINLYNKYDTQYGNTSLSEAPLRVNRGSIVPVPSSSGVAYNFGNFAVGLSIVLPDFEVYNAPLQTTSTTNSYLGLRDESLWVGGSLALNLTPQDSIGLTMYYTSRTFNRTITDRSETGGITTMTNEEKVFTHNDLLYILGYFRQISPNWSFGVSYRLPSMPISSQGTFYRSEINTSTGAQTPTSESDLIANTKVPTRVALGVAYRESRKRTFSFDLHYYGGVDYTDIENSTLGSDLTKQRNILNASFGAEYYYFSWMAIRAGLFTNFSANEEIPEQPTKRQGDYMDMWGFSANVALFTSEQTAFSLGGYYTGGKGYSVQQINQELERLPKSQQIFSFLVGTSYYF